MTVRVSKQPVNLREKLSELEKPIGLKGSELMRAETTQKAREFVSAGRKNLIHNGGMAVAQRGTSFTITSDSPAIFPVDRYRFHLGGLGSSATVTATRETNSGVPGFPNSIKISNAGNNTGSSNTDSWIRYVMELADYNFIDWGNTKKSLTLSFYARTNKPGQRSVSIVSGQFGQNHYIATFTLDAVDVWEKIEITVPPPPAFPTSGDYGLRLYWGLSVGSSYSTTTTNQWTSGNPFAATGDQKITGVDGATYEMTGVQLEVGKNATDFEHRPYGEELALCQRYYYNPMMDGSVMYPIRYLISTGNNGWTNWPVSFPTAMRIIPSLVSDLSDSNNTSGPPTDDQWAFYWQNQGYVSKTGNSDMSVLNISASATQANVGAYYVSPTNTNAASIKIGANRTFAFNAEL